MLRTSLVIASMLLVGCGNPFAVEAQAAALCQHLPAQRFAVPPEARQQFLLLPLEMRRGMQVEKTFDFDLGAQIPAEMKDTLNMKLSLSTVRLTVTNPSENLGFVDEAHLQLQPTQESGLEMRQFEYLRNEAAPLSVTWNGEAFDLGTYLDSGNLKYSVALVGAPPENDLVVDIDVCAAAGVQVEYL